jgi:hypothetical protein
MSWHSEHGLSSHPPSEINKAPDVLKANLNGWQVCMKKEIHVKHIKSHHIHALI